MIYFVFSIYILFSFLFLSISLQLGVRVISFHIAERLFDKPLEVKVETVLHGLKSELHFISFICSLLHLVLKHFCIVCLITNCIGFKDYNSPIVLIFMIGWNVLQIHIASLILQCGRLYKPIDFDLTYN